MSIFEEKQIERENIFDGVVLKVVKDKVLLPDGTTSYREFCLHNGGVAVLPLDADGYVTLVRQYRYAHRREFIEIPAGKLDKPGEIPLDAAMRELREETGATSEKITFLGTVDTTPALINEKLYLYLAEDLSFGNSELDEGEFLGVFRIKFEELLGMVMDGKIQDAKTQIAVLKTAKIKNML
jgi:ADP-ribose pyrophosphatase